MTGEMPGRAGRTTALEVHGGDHALLRRAHLWHHIAGDFCRGSFGLAIGAGVAAAALRPTAGDRHRTVL